MTDHRFEAHATIRPGEHEHRLDASGLQLVRVVLSDDGPVAAPDGSEHQRPDVVCPLRPSQARGLAARLLALAEHAETGAAR
ncbi:MAG: hypothetical protein LC777_13945 [Actinobacteria bacterium]|nr:hypothetical protein [Actinomycetota bacterium]